MTNSEILALHQEEMKARKSSLYQVFTKLEGVDLDPQSLKLLLPYVTRLVDAVICNGLPVEPEIENTIISVVQLPLPDAQRVLAAWNSAMAAAAPSIAAMENILNCFKQWLPQMEPNRRVALAEMLLHLANSIGGMKESEMQELLATVGGIKDDGDYEAAMRLIGEYGRAGTKNVLGILRIAHAALLFAKTDVLTSLREAFPPGRTRYDNDADRVLATIGRLSENCRRQNKALWSAAMELCVTILSKNHSSAYATARALPDVLGSLPVDVRTQYLTDFRDSVTLIGIRVIGFCLDTLPGHYRRYGPERTGRLVRVAMEAANSYGTTAGEWFLELKTQSARRMLAD